MCRLDVGRAVCLVAKMKMTYSTIPTSFTVTFSANGTIPATVAADMGAVTITSLLTGATYSASA